MYEVIDVPPRSTTMNFVPGLDIGCVVDFTESSGIV